MSEHDTLHDIGTRHETDIRPDNDITALRLTVGDPVEIRGQLVLRSDEIVVTGYRMLSKKPGVIPELTWELTPFVRLDLTDDEADAAEELLGDTIYGTGIWNRAQVTHCDLRADDSWAHPSSPPARDGASEDDGWVTKNLRAVSDEVSQVEAGVFARGIVLRRVRVLDARGPRVIVSATDVDVATRVLSGIYPTETLEVHESRWSVSELRALDDVLNDLPDDKVLKVDYRLDELGVISRKLRFDWVDDHLERVLGRFPPEMLMIEAIVEPAGTPQDRDPWMPPRGRPATT